MSKTESTCAPPPGYVVVCPICQHPKKICALLNTLEKENGTTVKFGDTEEDSAQKRSEHLRYYHAVICPCCRLPLKQCQSKKIASIIRKIEHNRTIDYEFKPYEGLDAQVQRLLPNKKCRPPKIKGKPVFPEWWKPKRGTSE